ncbi:hypothetical protein PghCCS26_47540 [Paenibacillus glycanilyticus]|uniref:Holin n=1 Tax=Paenibacillus glycanilyticus TaxID=126569 RepID=A0ABQ6NUG3_9BACL|nr:hypothetical protein PghCCS26_47540 [Paenibacillus glycanilyticus]
MIKSIWIPVVCGIIAQIVTCGLFDGTRAEGFIAYLLGVILGHIWLKEDAK